MSIFSILGYIKGVLIGLGGLLGALFFIKRSNKINELRSQNETLSIEKETLENELAQKQANEKIQKETKKTEQKIQNETEKTHKEIVKKIKDINKTINNLKDGDEVEITL